MKLGILCHAGYGGSTRIAAELSAELARRGHTVHLFARTLPVTACGPAENGVIVHCMAPNSGRDHFDPSYLHINWSNEEVEASLACMVSVSMEAELELLHFHHAMPFAFIVDEFSRRLGTASPSLVGTLHGTDVSTFGRDPDVAAWLISSLQLVDALTTVSASHARLVFELLGLHAEVIPNFVDTSRFAPNGMTFSDLPYGCRNLHDRARAPRIAHISNFRPVKDPLTVARIFTGIRARMDCELWLIGSGQEMEAVKRMLDESAYGADVRYLGFRQNVVPILAEVDLLVMSSKSESFCLAALEAMACGVPVLSTDVGGVPEVVVHGRTGFLYPPGNDAAAVELGLRLLGDPALLSTMGKAAALRARRFAQSKIVSRYEDLYERLMANRRTGCRAGSEQPKRSTG